MAVLDGKYGSEILRKSSSGPGYRPDVNQGQEPQCWPRAAHRGWRHRQTIRGSGHPRGAIRLNREIGTSGKPVPRQEAQRSTWLITCANCATHRVRIRGRAPVMRMLRLQSVTAAATSGDYVYSERRVRDSPPDMPGVRGASRHGVRGQRLS